jgi:hypothetical protein
MPNRTISISDELDCVFRDAGFERCRFDWNRFLSPEQPSFFAAVDNKVFSFDYTAFDSPKKWAELPDCVCAICSFQTEQGYKIAAATKSGNLVLFNTEGEQKREIDVADNPLISVSPVIIDGSQYFAVFSRDRKLRIYSLQTENLELQIGIPTDVLSLSIGNVDDRVKLVLQRKTDFSTEIWDLESLLFESKKKPEFLLRQPEDGFPILSTHLIPAKKGLKIIQTGYRNTISFYDMEALKPRMRNPALLQIKTDGPCHPLCTINQSDSIFLFTYQKAKHPKIEAWEFGSTSPQKVWEHKIDNSKIVEVQVLRSFMVGSQTKLIVGGKQEIGKQREKKGTSAQTSESQCFLSIFDVSDWKTENPTEETNLSFDGERVQSVLCVLKLSDPVN